jgi:Fic-DOC domain mobile mystery protein B
VDAMTAGKNGRDDHITPLDSDEKKQLIPALATKEALNEFEEVNIAEARAWALSPRTIRSIDPLIEPTIREVHRRMFNRTWQWAGKYRRTEKLNMGAPIAEIYERLGALLGNAQYWAQNNSFLPDEIAVRFHHELTLIHPFPNGNGRHARLYADTIALKLGNDVFTWGRANLHAGTSRTNYIEALQKADNGDIKALVAFARS